MATTGAVASGHPAATAAGVAMLRAGGSAVDAAVAADAVMGVVEPIATGIGGDLFAVVAGPDGVEAYDGAGRTGSRMGLSILAHDDHGYVPSLGGQAAVVPGAARGWWDLHQRRGRLPWATVLEPAVAAAVEGFRVGPIAAAGWAAQVKRLDEVARGVFVGPDGPPVAGSMWRNPELGALIAALASEGPTVFYDGAVAEAVAAATNRSGGAMDAADVQGHEGRWLAPWRTAVRDLELFTVAPPCQGLVVGVAASLLDEQGHFGDLSPAGFLALAEALDRAFAVGADEVFDRDPSEVPPPAALVAAARSKALRGPLPYGPGTVFTAAADADTHVALVSSVCDRFGCGVGVPGYGFVLSSRGRGFSVDPSSPNVVGPGKRPYHTIVPTVVLRSGTPWLSLGVVGGIMQPQGQLQILSRLIAGESVANAVSAPRVRLLGQGVVALEDAVPAAARELLGRVYDLRGPARVDFGGAQAVVRVGDRLSAGTDPRKDGVATVC